MRQQGGPSSALERTVSINLTYTSSISIYVFCHNSVEKQHSREREFKFLIESERKSLSSLALHLLLIVINLDKKIIRGPIKKTQSEMSSSCKCQGTLTPSLEIERESARIWFDFILVYVSSNYIMMISPRSRSAGGGLGYAQSPDGPRLAHLLSDLSVWVWHTQSGNPNKSNPFEPPPLPLPLPSTWQFNQNANRWN